MLRAFAGMIFALSFVACAAEPGSVEIPIGGAEAAVSENACHWRCNVCPPGRYCIQICEERGNCGETGRACNLLALCVEGYHFDETACRCLPGDGAPAAPGPRCGDAHCPAGTECCNESCGICVEPGGGCIELYCAPRDSQP